MIERYWILHGTILTLIWCKHLFRKIKKEARDGQHLVVSDDFSSALTSTWQNVELKKDNVPTFKLTAFNLQFFSFSHIPTPILVADMWSPTFIVNWSFLLTRFEISYYISAINSISLNFLSKSINTLFAAKVFRKSEPGDVEKPEQRPPHHHRPAAALRHVRVRGFQSCRVHQKFF